MLYLNKCLIVFYRRAHPHPPNDAKGKRLAGNAHAQTRLEGLARIPPWLTNIAQYPRCCSSYLVVALGLPPRREPIKGAKQRLPPHLACTSSCSSCSSSPARRQRHASRCKRGFFVTHNKHEHANERICVVVNNTCARMHVKTKAIGGGGGVVWCATAAAPARGLCFSTQICSNDVRGNCPRQSDVAVCSICCVPFF